MNWSEESKIAVESLKDGILEAVASNPKVQLAATTLGATVAAGTWAEALRGPWAFCLGAVTFLGLIAILRKNWLDGELTTLQIKLLKNQVENLGATPITEEIHDT